MKRILALLVCIFCASLTWGQTMTVNYNHAEKVSWVDNTANCITGHFNCWHLGNMTLTSVSAGAGYALGLNSSHQVLKFTDYPTNYWSVQTAMGTSMTQLAVGSASVVCGLAGTAVDCWNGSSWVYQNAQLSQLSAAMDGTIVGTNFTSHTIWQSAGAGHTWAQLPGTGFIFAAAQVFNGIIGLKTDFSVWSYDGTTWTQIPGGAKQAAIDNNGNLYIIGTTNLIYHYNGIGSNPWDALSGGAATSIANGGAMNVWIVGQTQSGSNVWRYSSQGLMLSTTLSGNTNCTGNGCVGATHTPHAQASWAGHHTGGAMVTGPGVTPTTQINLTASDTLYDPFLCFEDDPACVPSIEQTKVDCTVAGPGFYNPGNSGGLLPVDIEEATTRAKWTGGSGINCAKNPSKMFCDYPVVTYCTPESTPPDWTISPPYIFDVCATRDGFGNCLPPVVFGWDAQTICARRQEYRGTGIPWSCAPGLSILQDLDNPDTQPADCTHNP